MRAVDWSWPAPLGTKVGTNTPLEAGPANKPNCSVANVSVPSSGLVFPMA